MPASDVVDGLLEGHEAPGTRMLVRAVMVIYIIFTVFSGICNVAMIGHKGGHMAFPIVSVCILGFLGFSLFLVKSYRADTMDPKFRRAAIVLMIMIVVLDIASCMIFHYTITYKAPPPPPPPPTPAPTFAPFTPQPGAPPPTSHNTTHNFSRPIDFGEDVTQPPRRVGQQLQRGAEHRYAAGRARSGDESLSVNADATPKKLVADRHRQRLSGVLRPLRDHRTVADSDSD